ncbi:carbohydrate ABC transporter permease [Paenibacillus sp. CF384]|uniref:carbohydrate ABC transporter permease n=1 Tax=Paenibacillus sp. CF384 TaxID=1884382 RepID=UPI00089508C2|nr:sugar ABC transporter permease [Paenibacillus sp. CF384]SDX56081.1 carbohydrate ABC transporter membrane protein 1, CUT1 family [Paenibacillus sp. CF384]
MGKEGKREAVAGYLFIAPWIVGFVVFVLGALITAFYVSLTDWDLLTPSKWIGADNYNTLIHDKKFWISLRVTVIYVVTAVPLGIAFGFCIALLLNQKIKGLSVWRTIYYFPAILSGVAVSLMWMWVLNPDFGVINLLLSYVGIQGPGWIASPDWALPSLVLMSVWGAGGGMIIYLAGLQGIPTELYEAAEIDGCSKWMKLWKITIPMMTSVIFFNLIIGMISAFQTFTEAYVITNGGPDNATLFYAMYLYQNAFKFFKMGYASALAWVLFLIILLVTVLLFATSRKWVYYASGEENRG